jgi:4-aminobutyrate aminotransferase-like enzyme
VNRSQADKEAIAEKRRRFLGPNCAIFFPDDPLHIVRGRGAELFDPQGNSYLDCESMHMLCRCRCATSQPPAPCVLHTLKPQPDKL